MTRLRVNRRTLLKSAGITVAGILAVGKGSSVSAASYDVTEKSISDLQAAMSNGRTSAAEITQAYLDRIAAYDQVGPALNAVVYVNPNALRDARALDAERAAGRTRGPLTRTTTRSATLCARPCLTTHSSLGGQTLDPYEGWTAFDHG